ncbi:unnamed protein product, partial [Nesidiocoris tenuis]
MSDQKPAIRDGGRSVKNLFGKVPVKRVRLPGAAPLGFIISTLRLPHTSLDPGLPLRGLPERKDPPS